MSETRRSFLGSIANGVSNFIMGSDEKEYNLRNVARASASFAKPIIGQVSGIVESGKNSISESFVWKDYHRSYISTEEAIDLASTTAREVESSEPEEFKSKYEEKLRSRSQVFSYPSPRLDTLSEVFSNSRERIQNCPVLSKIGSYGCSAYQGLKSGSLRLFAGARELVYRIFSYVKEHIKCCDLKTILWSTRGDCTTLSMGSSTASTKGSTTIDILRSISPRFRPWEAPLRTLDGPGGTAESLSTNEEEELGGTHSCSLCGKEPPMQPESRYCLESSRPCRSKQDLTQTWKLKKNWVLGLYTLKGPTAPFPPDLLICMLELDEVVSGLPDDEEKNDFPHEVKEGEDFGEIPEVTFLGAHTPGWEKDVHPDYVHKEGDADGVQDELEAVIGPPGGGEALVPEIAPEYVAGS
ncbi:hypothetical protein OJ252_1181 [Cryptosporidium canis]|uniref:Uncharacterized protein n=1 Tax=Cryptosporidium canis TaxID=195482 RepID=A0ABQ8P9S0_9CRYT|nr:hypothetical protein OJ252_1181 [Cryptosporidium canis]